MGNRVYMRLFAFRVICCFGSGAVLILAGAVLLICGGCSKKIVHQAKLPADWPIPQLTLPADIELKAGPDAVNDSSLAPGDRRWVAGFNKDDNWPAYIAHVEGCLKPLSYWRGKNKGLNDPLGLDLPEMRKYVSPDYLTEVLITHGADFAGIGRTDIEFAMMVTVYEKPPEYLQLLIKHPNPSMGPKELTRLRDAILEPIT